MPNRYLQNSTLFLLSFLLVFTLLTATQVLSGGEDTTTRVSLDSSGNQTHDYSWSGIPSLSTDGRYVVFQSDASNLVPSDTNDYCDLYPYDYHNCPDIFVHDRETGETTRVSISSDGAEGNGYSTVPDISATGRYISFISEATNLVANDANSVVDVFVHDRETGQTERVTIAFDGSEADNHSAEARISGDGRYVVFQSDATNLVEGDTNGRRDVFVYDRETGQTEVVSVHSNGTLANNNSTGPRISEDGRYVSFHSDANNLIFGDTNGTSDIFVHDRETGQTTRVSISTAGIQTNGSSSTATISSDGRYVAFSSNATNLVAGDTNGETDIFLRDRELNETTRISIATDGSQANSYSPARPDISADGNIVIFTSWASNLVPGDVNGTYDVFLRDRVLAETNLVSQGSEGTYGNSWSWRPAISADGLLIVFESAASNLVGGDTNIGCDTNWDNIYEENCPDVFVRTRSTSPQVTSTATSTATSTSTATPTTSPSQTATRTATATTIPSQTATNTATVAPVATSTPTPLNSPTPSSTATQGPPPSATLTVSPTQTRTPTSTATVTRSPTATRTSTPTVVVENQFLPIIFKALPPTPTRTPTPTLTPVPPTATSTAVPTGGIQNGGFESGRVAWFEYSTQGWILIVSEQQSELPAHTGSWFSWLGGDYDEFSDITQVLTVPAAQPYLSYWYYIASDDYCGYDIGGVALLPNGSDEPIALDAYWLCETNNTNGYVNHVLDLSPWAGQQVELHVLADNDGSFLSSLFVDDFAFQGNTSESSSFGPDKVQIRPKARNVSISARVNHVAPLNLRYGLLRAQLRQEITKPESK